ncbi:J domain-containing protein [Massilia glaciei]|nr:tetratricopeptide repeat protein [Massilia glaciei]
MSDQPYYLERLGIAPDADERTIKRAYARALKLIDQDADPAGFQDLREAYEEALFWLRNQASMAQDEHEAEAIDPAPTPAQHRPDTGSVDTRAPEPGQAHESLGADTTALAMEVFTQFQQRCLSIADDTEAGEAWYRQLQAAIDDVRLISLGAREAFEQGVANLLAGGWQPGHHALFVAATRVFDWDMDRRRLLGLGMGGYTIDRALEQRAMYDLQPDQDCESQRQVIARLRDPQPPSTRELVDAMPTLATLAARFPTWLALITDTDKIASWSALHEAMPLWPQKMTPAWIRVMAAIVIAFIMLVYLATNGANRQSSDMQTVAAEHLERAEELLNAGDSGNAIASFDRALRADPNNAEAYAGRALAYIFNFDWERASGDLDKLETMAPSHARLYLGRGLLAVKDNRAADAIAAFTRSLELRPGSSFTYKERALVYEQIGQQDKALADADEAIRLQPDRYSAYSLRARVYLARGERQKLREQAAAVVAVDGRSDEAYITAARMHIDLGERKEALALVDRGVALAPTASIHVYRAAIRPSSDIAGRRADLKTALKLDPDFPGALRNLAELERDAGRYEEAIAAFDQAIANDSTQGMRAILLAGRGSVYAKLGDTVAADRAFASARFAATTPIGLNNLCWYLAVENAGLQTALAACDASLEQSPESAHTLDSKGLVLVRLNRFREAVAAYDEAVRRKPAGGAWSRYGRGIAKHRLGDVKGGDADMKAAQAENAGVAQEYAAMGVSR